MIFLFIISIYFIYLLAKLQRKVWFSSENEEMRNFAHICITCKYFLKDKQMIS